MVEVVRSCPEMCRFCLASYLSLPFRAASLSDSLIPSIERGLEATDRIGLLGASVTQVNDLSSELVKYFPSLYLTYSISDPGLNLKFFIQSCEVTYALLE